MTKYILSSIGSTVITALMVVMIIAGVPAHAGEQRVALTSKSAVATDNSIERGRYLVKFGGCNDCHTPGFAQAGGHAEEKNWLVGDVLGYQGPWGTTFPINIRQFAGALTEDQWVVATRNSKARPPMPVWVFRDTSEQDLRAIYRFIRSLGVAGEVAPAYVPPGVATKYPTVQWPH